MGLPRAIALDIETAPQPAALARLAECPPDFRPQDLDGVARLFSGALTGVGEKIGADFAQALGSTQDFYALVDAHDGATMAKRIGAAGLIKGKVKASPADFDSLIEGIHNAQATWYSGLVRRCSFDPFLCRVVSVGLSDGETEGVLHLGEYGETPSSTSFGGSEQLGDEAQLLRDLWAWLAAFFGPHPAVLVTFNGIAFDSFVLRMRSAVLGVEIPFALEGPKYRYEPTCDLYEYLTGWGRHLRPAGENTLLFFARLFGIVHETKESGMDGSQVAGLVDQGRWDEIATYNLEDARVTWRLFDRVRSQLFPASRSSSSRTPELARKPRNTKNRTAQVA
jgi:hypothetical protein